MNGTLRAALRDGIAVLREAEIDGASRDARLLLAHQVGLPADRLSLHLDDPMSEEAAFFYPHLLRERAGGRPVSRILGRRMFWGRDFEVTDDVLDPRPETECLIDLALKSDFSEILDLGTGSGILAVTLLAERPGATGIATDISRASLEVAERNAAAHGVAGRLGFVDSDWFDAVGGRFDLIVSNPPYIAWSEMDGLAREVRGHDPRISLTDEADGLAAYRRIASGVGGHLRPGGQLLVEHGPTQAAAIAEIFRAAGLEDVVCHPDLDGRDRVTLAQAPAKKCA